MEKLGGLVRMDLEPMRRTSVLVRLSLRKLSENQDLISYKQQQREEGGRVVVGLVER